MFLEDLLARADRGPLAPLTRVGGEPALVDVESASSRIVVCGLNELAEELVGSPLHASEASRSFAERFLGAMRRQVDQLSRKRKLRLVLAATGESLVAARLAKLDLRYHPELAAGRVRGDLASGEITYSGGVSFDAPSNLQLSRLQGEGRLSGRLAESESVVSAASLRGDTGALVRLVMEAYDKTSVTDLRLSP